MVLRSLLTKILLFLRHYTGNQIRRSMERSLSFLKKKLQIPENISKLTFIIPSVSVRARLEIFKIV